MRKRIVAFLLALAVIAPFGIVPKTEVSAEEINTLGRKSYNVGLSAVPAPGSVIIDGNFDEWDWSGRAKHYADYELTDLYSCESAFMWDKENLYLGFKFNDETPAMSLIDPVLEPSWTWRGDAIQLRFVTDRPTAWVTIAPNEKTDVGSLHITYPDETDMISYVTDPGDTKLKNVTSEKGVPKLKCFEAEIKYKRWEDGKGYNMEMKIPWKMLFLSPNSIFAGKTMTMHLECYWGKMINDAVYHESSVFDNFLPGKSGGGNRSPEVWGLLTLEANGNLPLREYKHESEDNVAGTIEIETKVPKEAKKLSLVLEDKHGNRIAYIVSEHDVEANIVREEADGYIVKALWDGTDTQGAMVTPGEYTVKGIYHNGIKPVFDYTAYNPGNPPWPSSTGTGSWGSDHMAASSLASYGDTIYLGHRNAESGTGLFALGPDDTKKWGIMRGAEYMAANESYVYTLPGNDFYANTANAGNMYLMRVDSSNGKMIPFTDKDGNDKDLLLFINEILGIKGGVMPSVGGLAANSKYIVLTTKNNNIDVATPGIINYGASINVLDVEKAEMIRKIAVPDVGYAAFGKNGLLYAVTGDTISEVNVETGKVRELPIKAPKGGEFSVITTDSDGNIIVFDKGEDKQLKVYTTSGQLLYTIGKKGGRDLVGKWDPDGFTEMVSGVAVTNDGNIWVSERWNYPRRLSVWNKNGFVKDYIGNPGYQGAGTWLDETDPNIVYIGSNKVIVDKENMTYKMDAILWVPDRSKGEAFAISPNANSRKQMISKEINGVTNKYIYSPGSNYDASSVMYRFISDYEVKPFWATGRIDHLWQEFGYGYYTEPKETMIYFSDKNKKTANECFPYIANLPADTQYIWNDYNYDGAVQYEECEFIFPANTLTTYNTNSVYDPQPQITNSGWGNIVSDNMTFIMSDRMGRDDNERPGLAYLFEPEYYTEDGLPRYTRKSIKPIDAEKGAMDWENCITPDGTRMISIASRHRRTNSYRNGIKVVDLETGKDLWWFRNAYPGVHGGHAAPVGKEGEVLGPIKQLGTVEVNGIELFAMRGYYGQDFFMTTDGYYIQTICKDSRTPKKRLPDDKFAAKDMDLNGFSEGCEPYSGTMVKHSDGVVRLVTSIAGPSVLVARIEGLDTIRYIEPFKLSLTKQMLDEAKEFNRLSPEEKAGEEEKKEETVSGLTIYKTKGEMTIDGSKSDWGNIPDVKVSQSQVEESANVKMAYDDKNLYVLYDVKDTSPMMNSGSDIYHIFKSGDVCDINISPTGNTSPSPSNGDLRLYMSEVDGKPIAMLLKQVSAEEKKPFAYTSPVMGIEFDYVQQRKDIEMKISKSEASYILEARIPLDALGLKAEPGKVITGDIGIISSDEYGVDNIARTYFFNKDTGLTEDVPGEVKLVPNNWGKITFEK